ncbi:MAG: DUF4440 domain-containing protein [Gammaproteobacteria bacterium]
MEALRHTLPHLLDIQSQLSAREPLFYRPEFGTTRQEREAMLAEDFWEVGASGRRYSRAYILDALQADNAAVDAGEWQTQDFYCQQLAIDTYLLTYTLRQGNRVTRRTTIWRWQQNRWVACYHQGTLVASA